MQYFFLCEPWQLQHTFVQVSIQYRFVSKLNRPAILASHSIDTTKNSPVEEIQMDFLYCYDLWLYEILIILLSTTTLLSFQVDRFYLNKLIRFFCVHTQFNAIFGAELV